jgi:assimilatory nitrate reductase catalytic subunit
VLQDAGTGLFRAARVQNGVLHAVIFIGPDHALPQRDWLVSLFAQDRLTLSDRRALLAGRPADGVMPEPPVCVCFGIGAGAIGAAIADGCGSVEAVGERTKAGTNCGSCRPEIRTLLAALQRQSALSEVDG